MIPRSPSYSNRSLALQAVFPACFPSAAEATGNRRTLPERPRRKDPVLDPENSYSVPLREFDEHTHGCVYASERDGGEAALPAAAPEGFSDEYLMPSLTRNERLRLTMLWYHTNGLLDDQDFLARLQTIVELVQTFFQGWEFAIMGFVFEDAFTRVATVGMPLAMVPRRESPCSHTVTQLDSGKVFFLPDMLKDWRFQASPTAKQGLRGYAGAQLRCDTPAGESVALGSLCIASNHEQPHLTSAQQNALVRFADMLSAEIVTHSRAARKHQRQIMVRLLAECRLDDVDAEERILDVVHQIYPQAHVKFSEPCGNELPLPGHKPIDLCDINESLWEDTEAIEALITTHNHKNLSSTHTVRAIIHPVQTYPVVRYLVVASSQVQMVFDDVDAWFVQACALSLGKVIHERIFGEALMVKERFLRGITHQLRTPIHGVLASCELLTEELSHREMLGLAPQSCCPSATVFTILDSIRDSGKELMNTVNNMLKLNRWTETTVHREPVCHHDWTRFEDDILSEVEQTMPGQEHADVSIFFHNSLCKDETTVSVDIALLKECIQSLVLNALQVTKQGSIIITTNATPDFSGLEMDVIDTGCGIASADQERIFEAYEKVDVHTRGVGLGLTLARNISKLMDGNVTLITSSQDEDKHGSHFRVTIALPSPIVPAPVESSLLPEVPGNSRTGLTFRRAHHQEQQHRDLTLNFARFLEGQGFKQTETGQASIALLPHVSEPKALARLLADTPAKIGICLTPPGATTPPQARPQDRLLTFSGPFTSLRLKQILSDIQQACEAIHNKASKTETSGTLENAAKNGTTTAPGLTHPGLSLDPSLPPPTPVDITPHALLVDDNMVNLKIMRMYCEKRGIAHVTATNGREAVDAFRAALQPGCRPLNFVAMDLQMPMCDGADATREIREIEEAAAAAREGGSVAPPRKSCIFMVTGQDSLADKARSFAAGADEFYVKPMGMKKLDGGIGVYFPSFAKGLSGASLK